MERREKTVAFPTFVDGEVVLARDISDPVIANGLSFDGRLDDYVTRLMTLVGDSVVSDCTYAIASECNLCNPGLSPMDA